MNARTSAVSLAARRRHGRRLPRRERGRQDGGNGEQQRSDKTAHGTIGGGRGAQMVSSRRLPTDGTRLAIERAAAQ